MIIFNSKKRFFLVITFLFLLLSLVFIKDISGEEIGVSTPDELADTVNSANDGDIIKLKDDFIFDKVNINKTNDTNITIDGENKVFTSGNININGSGNGSIIVKNLKFTQATESRAFNIYSNAKIILDNVQIFERTKFDSGGAILLGGASNVDILNSTFENNICNGSGYDGGAIAAKGFGGKLKVNNCVFKGNKTTVAGTGNFGGEGGAISFNMISSTAVINIYNSYFAENEAVKDASVNKIKLADGGALSFFNIVQGSTLNIEGNTFYKNIAGDDGGAILIQTNSNLNSGIKLANNTFYMNEAQGLDDTISNGGAIQFYSNGSLFEGRKAVVNLENNSFIKNKAKYRGGAIAGSGYATNMSGSNSKNNIFVGNISTIYENYNNVDQPSNVGENLGGNIGFDNGTKSNITIEDVFGKSEVALVDNYSGIKAGYEEDRIVIPSIPIAPELLADEVADSTNYDKDQRELPRTGGNTDVGSVEISWIKYDANGGTFALPELTHYNGIKYYEGTNTNKYYDVNYIDANNKIKSKEDLNLLKGDENFLGWSTNPDAISPDVQYKEGKEITHLPENLVLYAVWKKDGGSTGGGGGGTVDPPNTMQSVILASGEKYTDVLTATVLGNEKNCPILLTTRDSIDEKTIKEIKRLGVSEVIISGGPDSVSDKVIEQLNGYKVRRVAGVDRYETAVKIGAEVRSLAGNLDEVMLVDGTNFPDVITISTLASLKRVPILITQPDQLVNTTKDSFKEWSIKNVTIGGSYNSVSKNVENSLGDSNIRRLGGVDRYETAELIGAEVRKLTGNTSDMILVDGTDFPDGITINSLASKFKSPIMLTTPDKLINITEDKISEWSIKNILIGGGYNSVSKYIENNLNVDKKERVAGEDRYETAVKISQRLTQTNKAIGKR